MSGRDRIPMTSGVGLAYNELEWPCELTADELSQESIDILLGVSPSPRPTISKALANLGKGTAMLLSSVTPSTRHIVQAARDRELEIALEERRAGDYMQQPDFSEMRLLNEQGSAALKAMSEQYHTPEESVHVTPRGLTGKEASKRKSRNKLASASKKRNR